MANDKHSLVSVYGFVILVTLFFLIIIVSAGLVFLVHRNAETIVITKNGAIQGVVMERLGVIVHSFYGIPFAKPPIGQLRFRKPEVLEPWTGVLHATKLPHACVQVRPKRGKAAAKILTKFPELYIMQKIHYVEDCLYLNIFAPQSQDMSLKTVMVWIHGGSFISGYSAIPFYDGISLAALGDVIVVSINYRLGLLGFMSSPNGDISPNLGLLDQVTALKWIQGNIKAFGGDPDNVVLFGESAGGISVGYHLVSPLSQPLFKRAILQSGNAVVPIALHGPKHADRVYENVANLSGCTEKNSGKTGFEDSVYHGVIINDCLRQVSAKRMLEIQNEIAEGSPLPPFTPLEDGSFLPQHPFELVLSERFGPQKEILIGSNANEGALFVRYSPLSVKPENFSVDNIVAILSRNEMAKAFFYDWYRNITITLFEDVDKNNSDEVWNRYVQVVGDAIFLCPDYLFIESFAASNRSAYYYHFKPHPSLALWDPEYGPDGAVHADELAFMFGRPIRYPEDYNEEEVSLSKRMVKIWTTFAKTGNTSEEWIPYDAKNPKYFVFDTSVSEMKSGFPGLHCDKYYNEAFLMGREYVRNSFD